MGVRLRHAHGRWVAFDALMHNLLQTDGVHAVLAVGRPVSKRGSLALEWPSSCLRRNLHGRSGRYRRSSWRAQARGVPRSSRTAT